MDSYTVRHMYAWGYTLPDSNLFSQPEAELNQYFLGRCKL